MSSSGPGGVTYSSTTTHRRGPGGVAEKTHHAFDSRTGQETIQLERGLGEKVVGAPVLPPYPSVFHTPVEAAIDL